MGRAALLGQVPTNLAGRPVEVVWVVAVVAATAASSGVGGLLLVWRPHGVVGRRRRAQRVAAADFWGVSRVVDALLDGAGGCHRGYRECGGWCLAARGASVPAARQCAHQNRPPVKASAPLLACANNAVDGDVLAVDIQNLCDGGCRDNLLPAPTTGNAYHAPCQGWSRTFVVEESLRGGGRCHQGCSCGRLSCAPQDSRGLLWG